jgi:hypothetical protein
MPEHRSFLFAGRRAAVGLYDPLEMDRRRLAWLLSVPLMLAGIEAAHWLAFRLVYANAWERSQALAQSGHSYLGDWLPAAAVASALSLSALALQIRERAGSQHGRAPLPPPAAAFAVLPPLAFAIQEHLESLLHAGTLTGVAESPTFLVGVALQLPFALIAYLLARLMLRVADLVGRRLASEAPRPGPAACLRPRRRDLRALTPLALVGTSPGRGPPIGV